MPQAARSPGWTCLSPWATSGQLFVPKTVVIGRNRSYWKVNGERPKTQGNRGFSAVFTVFFRLWRGGLKRLAVDSPCLAPYRLTYTSKGFTALGNFSGQLFVPVLYLSARIVSRRGCTSCGRDTGGRRS